MSVDDTPTVRGGNELAYHGVRADLSSYQQSVVRTAPLRSSELFSIWPCRFDGEAAILKEAAGGPRSNEAKIRLRREQAIMRRLVTERRRGQRLTPFLGAGTEIVDQPGTSLVDGHEHHFTQRLVTLRNHLDADLAVGARADLVVAAFRALADLHDAAVLHRDLKPSNLVLDVEDGRVEFIDFGHALDQTAHPGDDEPATGESGFVGTEGWMCPHCYLERTTDPLCDVFAMALVSTVILTGEIQRPPLRTFGGGDATNTASRGLVLPAHRSLAVASLETYRDRLSGQDLGALRSRLLTVLLQALTPAPRTDGVAARPTALVMHDELVAARRRRSKSDAAAPPASSSDGAIALPSPSPADEPADGPPLPPQPDDDPRPRTVPSLPPPPPPPSDLPPASGPDEPDEGAPAAEPSGDAPGAEDAAGEPEPGAAPPSGDGAGTGAGGGATAGRESRKKRVDGDQIGYGSLPTKEAVAFESEIFMARTRGPVDSYRLIDLLAGMTATAPVARRTAAERPTAPAAAPTGVGGDGTEDGGAASPTRNLLVVVGWVVAILLLVVLVAIVSVNGV